MKKKFTILITAAVMLLTMMATTGTMWGQTREDLVLTFSLTSNPGGWPTANSTTLTNYTYTLNTVEYTFALMNVKCNSGYLMLTQPAVLGVPAIEGYKLTKIVASNSSGCSTSTKVGISSSASSPSYIGGGEIQTWSTQSSSYTYTLTSTAANTMYYIYVTNKNAQIISLALTYAPGGGGSDPTIILSESGTLNIGNYAVNTELDSRTFTVSQSNLSEGITLTATNGGTLTPNSIDLDADPTEVTWNFTTPAEAGQFTSVITATSGETSASFTYLGYAYANHNVIIAEMEHGTVIADPTSTYYYQNVTLTVTPDEGYELGTLSVVDGNNDPVTVTNNSFKMPDSDATVSATFVESSGSTVTDELTNSNTIGETTNNYSEWTATGISGAEYAGQSAGGNGTIQLRSNNSNSGIVSTTSGGKVKKVTVTWNSNTADARTLNIYGSNTAYTAASDLYGNNAGTLLGTLNKGNEETNLNITDDYAYIGIRSASGALYLDKIEIDWETSGTPTCAAPTFTPAAGTVLSGTTVAISTTTADATIYYTMGANPDDPTTSSAVYSTPIEITEATTIKAMAVKDGYNNSSIASASYTIATPLTTMQEIFDAATSTATNVYITFDNWVVSGASNTNAYVTDGTKGFIITNYSGHGFVEGDILSGTAQCSLNTNLGMARLQNFTSTADGLTVTTGGTVDFADIAMADLTAVNAGALLHYTNLLCSKISSNYFLTDGTTTLQVYTALWPGFTNVLEDGKYYNITGVYHNFNTTKEICPRRADDIVEYSGTSLSINPATAEPFTYLHNDGPSEDQLFQVTGENLTSDDIVATITSGAEYFEITDDEEYSSTVTVNSGDYISVRMKAGLAKGSYEGTLTLSSTGAENIVVNLTGTVTGVTYTIESIASNGTISFNPASPVEDGIQVTMTATPTEGYEFEANSWKFYNANTLDEVTLDVTDGNKITMPAYNLAVDATFNAKPTNAITCVISPLEAAEMVTDATNDLAYEGQFVTLTIDNIQAGYNLSSIVITKTEDGSATGITPTASGDDYTFTMPGYAVTVTATFISNTFEGSFVKVTTLNDLEDDGDYVLVFNSKAMNSTLTSGRMGAVGLTITDNTITDPDRSIVWKLEENGDNWDLYSEKEGKYCYIDGDGTSKFAMGDEAEYSFVVTRYNDGGFKFLTTEEHGRGIYQIAAQYASYAASNNPEVYLYKYTVLTERTITFNGNGGTTPTGETYTQTVYDGIATNLTANQFTKENSAFIGWSTTQNGDVEYADGASITVSGDITLYAQWSTAYTAMVDDQIVGGTVKVNDEDIVEVAAGTEMTLTYTANPGYAFSEWNVYKEGDETTTVEVTENSFTMPAYDVIVSATFVEVTTYSLVTNVNQIVSGKHYLIASGTEGSVKAMGQQYTNNRAAVSVTINGTTISKTEGVYEFVINGPDANDNYIIYDVENKGFLYAAGSGSGKNYLKTQSTNDNNGLWSFSINETGAATVIAQGSNTNNYMRFNNSLFSCYASGSSIKDPVYFYMKDNDYDLEFYGSEVYSGTSIPTGGTITVGTGSVMTVPAEFTNDDPANLIIEDGGQLIHNVPVSATIQRNVKGYNANRDANNSGYMLIASPVSASIDVTSTNLINGTYDLYIFDEGQQDNKKEWRNYKANEFTTIDNTKGYLYANESNGTISFAGELKPSINPVTINLDYTDGNRFAGWNLVGNPFACNAYAYDTIGKSLAFFKMNTTGDGFVAVTTGAIAPMEGIFVKASEASQNFAFTKEAPVSNPGKGNLNIQVAQVVNSRDAQPATDNAIIRFDGGNTLEKFSFSEDNAKLYIPQNGKDYAVISADTQGEMPVNFKAAENGTYTIDFSMDNVEFSYLHLIDNKTGMDIDLLQTSSYTFEASKIDYASRFKLVFSTSSNSNSNDDNDFGFFDANGNFLILGIEGTATLQVMDVTGRVISNETFSGNYSKAINAKAGVYMLRLIQGNDVRTQKIVVR